MSHRTHDGRRVRILNLIDEYTRQSLAILPRRRWRAHQVIETVADAMLEHGIPEHIRSDNGPEFVAKDLRRWLESTGTKTLYIEPGSPWENPYVAYCTSLDDCGKNRFEAARSWSLMPCCFRGGLSSGS